MYESGRFEYCFVRSATLHKTDDSRILDKCVTFELQLWTTAPQKSFITKNYSHFLSQHRNSQNHEHHILGSNEGFARPKMAAKKKFPEKCDISVVFSRINGWRIFPCFFPRKYALRMWRISVFFGGGEGMAPRMAIFLTMIHDFFSVFSPPKYVLQYTRRSLRQVPLETSNQFAPVANLNEYSEFRRYVPSVKRSQSSNNRYVRRRPVVQIVNKIKHVNKKIVIIGDGHARNSAAELQHTLVSTFADPVL
jgi:hypothetical protein